MAIINVPSPVQILFVDRLLKGDKGDVGTGGTGTAAVAFHETLYDHGDIHTHSNKGSLDQITVGSSNELFINGANYADILTLSGATFLPVLSWLPADSAVVAGDNYLSASKSNTTKVFIEFSFGVSIDTQTPDTFSHVYLMRGATVLRDYTGYPAETGGGDTYQQLSWNIQASGILYLTDYAGETIYIRTAVLPVELTLTQDCYLKLSAMQ